MFEYARLILLTTIGARSGRPHTVPLAFLHSDDGSMLVIGSAAGSPRNPAWFHNLRAEPQAKVETGVFTLQVEATVLDGAQRDDAFARAAATDPGWAEYQAKTERVIPVVALRPVGGEFPDLPEGDSLRAIHDAFRRELAIVRHEVASASGPVLAAQLRINCLTACAGLHHHHGQEDGGLFPGLRASHPELAPVVDLLDEEHAKLSALLDSLQELVSSDSAEPGAVLPEVDRLIAAVEAHLDHEERELVPLLNTR